MLTFLDVGPLELVHLRLCEVFEFVLDIRFPSNSSILDGDRGAIILDECEGIVEKTLGNKTAWECWFL